METSSTSVPSEGLSPDESAAIREKIARRANVSVGQATAEMNLIRDLKFGGPLLGMLTGKGKRRGLKDRQQ